VRVSWQKHNGKEDEEKSAGEQGRKGDLTSKIRKHSTTMNFVGFFEVKGRRDFFSPSPLLPFSLSSQQAHNSRDSARDDEV
jgi:hypothetical protein